MLGVLVVAGVCILGDRFKAAEKYVGAFECIPGIKLSDEHLDCEWLGYRDAMSRLTWDSNKTALYKRNCQLSAEN